MRWIAFNAGPSRWIGLCLLVGLLSESTPALGAPTEAMTVRIDADGRTFLDGKAADDSAIRKTIRADKEQPPTARLVVQASFNAPYNAIERVLAAVFSAWDAPTLRIDPIRSNETATNHWTIYKPRQPEKSDPSVGPKSGDRPQDTPGHSSPEPSAPTQPDRPVGPTGASDGRYQSTEVAGQGASDLSNSERSGGRKSDKSARPLRVGGDVQQSKLIKKVEPIYPERAKRERIAGLVLLSIIVDETGRVASIDPVRGPTLLVPASVLAVCQWRYAPTLSEGKPIAVTAMVTVNYTLR